MDEADLDRLLEKAKIVARKAGVLVVEAHRKRALQSLGVESKGGVDLVTATDKASEVVIFNALREATPRYSFVGEEGTFVAGTDAPDEIGPEPTWVVDPLDGTTNFVHGLPMVCICICLLYRWQPVLGVVYNPILDELYEARKYGGAKLNGRPIHVGRAKDITEALVVNNIGSSRSPEFAEMTLARLKYLMGRGVRGLRNLGSAGVNMAWVASGVVDAYYEDGFGGPWDVAAGAIIVNEAGGCCCTPRGNVLEFRSLGKGKILCGNQQIVESISASIRAADAEHKSNSVGVLLRSGSLRIDILHFALASIAAIIAYWHFARGE